MTSLSEQPLRPNRTARSAEPGPAMAARDFAERGVAAEGATARDWLARHGIVAATGGDYLRLFADAVGSEELTLRRMWHTAREVQRCGRHGGAVVSLLVEGTLTLRGAAGGEQPVDEGGGFVLWSGSSVTAISQGRCGTIEVAVGRQVLERFFAWTDVGVTAIPAGLVTTRILLSAVSAALTGPLRPEDPAWRLISSMMGSGIGALLAELGPALHRSAPVTAVRLLRRAYAVIERHCDDAAFDVRALASTLSVSVASVYAAFAHSPCTPAQAIRSARVRLAHRMLDLRLSPTAADQEAVAELAGFTSAEAMSKALRADRRAVREG